MEGRRGQGDSAKWEGVYVYFFNSLQVAMYVHIPSMLVLCNTHTCIHTTHRHSLVCHFNPLRHLPGRVPLAVHLSREVLTQVCQVCSVQPVPVSQ